MNFRRGEEAAVGGRTVRVTRMVARAKRSVVGDVVSSALHRCRAAEPLGGVKQQGKGKERAGEGERTVGNHILLVGIVECPLADVDGAVCDRDMGIFRAKPVEDVDGLGEGKRH